MSREVRRVPLDWKHPVEHNPQWGFQSEMRQRRGAPASRLHAPDERFQPLQARSALAYYELGEELPNEGNFMPIFEQDERDLGWCFYETVSEGSPVTPVFVTAQELIDHLCIVGQDYDQVPMRRASAEQVVSTGGTACSMVVSNGTIYRSDVDADLLAALPTLPAMGNDRG